MAILVLTRVYIDPHELIGWKEVAWFKSRGLDGFSITKSNKEFVFSGIDGCPDLDSILLENMIDLCFSCYRKNNTSNLEPPVSSKCHQTWQLEIHGNPFPTSKHKQWWEQQTRKKVLYDLPARAMRLNTPLVSFQVGALCLFLIERCRDAVLMISMARNREHIIWVWINTY